MKLYSVPYGNKGAPFSPIQSSGIKLPLESELQAQAQANFRHLPVALSFDVNESNRDFSILFQHDIGLVVC